MSEIQAAPDTIEARVRALAFRYQHFLKYLIIGASASATDVLLFMFLFNGLHTDAIVAHSVSVPTSVLLSFTINARQNFRTTDRIALRLMSFAAVAAVGYFAGLAVIGFFQAQGVSPNLGKLASLPVVFALQYVLNSRITFYKGRKA